MAIEATTTGLTYEDLDGFPDDNLRREIIDGDLIVTAAPGGRHQESVAALVVKLWLHAREHGGKVYPAPRDVFFSKTSVVQPDVLYVRQENLDRAKERFVRGAPDIVVEVSSPTMRRLELVRKRDLYERHGVPEYWYVDLDAERIEVYTLEGGRYGHPRMLGRGESLESPLVPGLSISVSEVLGPLSD
jgi:Uma2 family endonuclease